MDFSVVVDELNNKIKQFNRCLAERCQFPMIDMVNSNSYSTKFRDTWGGDSWANKDSFGVYVLFGCDKENHEFGIYIGKASHQFIGV